MQRTFITRLPDHAGSFLDACRIIRDIGANITRVSYSKAVDIHTLFLDAAGTEEQLDAIADALRSVGYLQETGDAARVLLLDFELENRAGSMLPVLELIDSCGFNISYLSAVDTDQPVQHLKLGLFVEDRERLRAFLREATEKYDFSIVRHENDGVELDRSLFYIDFVNYIIRTLDLGRDAAPALMTHSNEIMQNLTERNEPPFRTFKFIRHFADLMAKSRGGGFLPNVDRRILTDGFELFCIQPPCGSNTWILRHGDDLLFVDSGFTLYRQEMTALLRVMFPKFDDMRRGIIVTHPDMDHCGLLRMFDTVWVSPMAYRHFELENEGKPAFREMDARNAPYCAIARILSRYVPPRMNSLRVVDGEPDDPDADICPLGHIDFCGRRIDFYRGNGGHTKGEIVAVDEADRLVFCGDILVNVQGFTRLQYDFNLVGPYLLNSVNLDSKLASRERKRLIEMFPRGRWYYCCGHGALMEPEAPKARAEDEKGRNEVSDF